MSLKLGIDARYVCSSKGSPFNQRHAPDTGKSGDDTGPPTPEKGETGNSGIHAYTDSQHSKAD